MASKPNPNPKRISAALWAFWLAFKAFEAKALYGGTYAAKAGYHNFRAALSARDYSVEDVANDRKGDAQISSAIDITLPVALMILYSKRLAAAMKARDKRLFINGLPILREFIGTLDGKVVYCYVLTGGRAVGVGADSGVDWGRDKSHLWHIHISFIRMFANSADAMERVLSILKGETYTAWAKRHGIGVTPKPPTKPSTPAKPATPPKTTLPSYKPGSRELKAGMKGTDVKWVQTFIGKRYAGTADGVAGPKFTAAVRWYQKMRGLAADGVVGPKTWRQMLKK